MVMAQTIVTLCDLHLGQGIEVAAQSYRVSLDCPGAKQLRREIDLCVDCAKIITDLAAVLTEQGRPAEPNNVAERICPACSFVSTSISGLASHARSAHGATIAELRGKPLPYACESCSKTFATPQGLGAHAYRAHGVSGSGKTAKHESNGVKTKPAKTAKAKAIAAASGPPRQPAVSVPTKRGKR